MFIILSEKIHPLWLIVYPLIKSKIRSSKNNYINNKNTMKFVNTLQIQEHCFTLKKLVILLGRKELLHDFFVFFSWYTSHQGNLFLIFWRIKPFFSFPSLENQTRINIPSPHAVSPIDPDLISLLLLWRSTNKQQKKKKTCQPSNISWTRWILNDQFK